LAACDPGRILTAFGAAAGLRVRLDGTNFAEHHVVTKMEDERQGPACHILTL
jgi:hypothetical protein